MKKILVAVDGSEPSKRACRMAKDLAFKFDSDIILVNVVPGLVCRACGITTFPNEIKGSKEMLLEFKEGFEDIGERVETLCLQGDIASEILACAKREQVDLIVMGSRGPGVLSRTLLGSVSNKVVNSSNVSVLIAK